MFRDDHAIKLLLVCLGTIPILLTSVVAGYFAFSKPERLQSEDYQLRQQTLRIIEEKGGRIKVNVVALEEISNPPKGGALSAAHQADAHEKRTGGTGS